MPNVVITVAAKSFTIDFGDYNKNALTYSRSMIKGIENCSETNCATLMMRCNRDYLFSYEAQDNCQVVDAVDTVNPSSMSDLVAKLTALIDY